MFVAAFLEAATTSEEGSSACPTQSSFKHVHIQLRHFHPVSESLHWFRHSVPAQHRDAFRFFGSFDLLGVDPVPSEETSSSRVVVFAWF